MSGFCPPSDAPLIEAGVDLSRPVRDVIPAFQATRAALRTHADPPDELEEWELD